MIVLGRSRGWSRYTRGRRRWRVWCKPFAHAGQASYPRRPTVLRGNELLLPTRWAAVRYRQFTHHSGSDSAHGCQRYRVGMMVREARETDSTMLKPEDKSRVKITRHEAPRVGESTASFCLDGTATIMRGASALNFRKGGGHQTQPGFRQLAASLSQVPFAAWRRRSLDASRLRNSSSSRQRLEIRSAELRTWRTPRDAAAARSKVRRQRVPLHKDVLGVHTQDCRGRGLTIR